MFHQISQADGEQVESLFHDVFTAAEGADEGRVVSGLARSLVDSIRHTNNLGFASITDGKLTAAVLFSPLVFEQGPVTFLLSPMAVATAHQRQGLGQRLIEHALAQLRDQGAELVVTYGDPSFYGKSGFSSVATLEIPPPYPLSFPEGWLANELQSGSIACIHGPAQCVAAFNKPELW